MRAASCDSLKSCAHQHTIRTAAQRALQFSAEEPLRISLMSNTSTALSVSRREEQARRQTLKRLVGSRRNVDNFERVLVELEVERLQLLVRRVLEDGYECPAGTHGSCSFPMAGGRAFVKLVPVALRRISSSLSSCACSDLMAPPGV